MIIVDVSNQNCKGNSPRSKMNISCCCDVYRMLLFCVGYIFMF